MAMLVAAASAQQRPSIDLATVVARMTQAQVEVHSNMQPYQVTREYKFFQGTEDSTPDSHVVADVTYYPPDSKQYEIVNATGGGRGQHVVRKVLDQETQMAGQWRQNALTEDNYKFSMLGEETLNGRRCFILGLEPRRDAKDLIEGKAWVDAENFRVRRIQGEPAKSPSFWIKKLSVTLTFGEVQGMWLQTAVHADADVRMFGKNILSERDINYRVGSAVASRRTLRRNSSETNIATFIR